MGSDFVDISNLSKRQKHYYDNVDSWAESYISGIPLNDLSARVGVSRATLSFAFKMYLPLKSTSLYNKVIEVAKYNTVNLNTLSARDHSVKEEVVDCVSMYIDSDLSFEAVADICNIKAGTLRYRIIVLLPEIDADLYSKFTHAKQLKAKGKSRVLPDCFEDLSPSQLERYNTTVEYATYLIDNNCTISCVAEHYGIQKSFLSQRFITYLKPYNKALYDKVSEYLRSHNINRVLSKDTLSPKRSKNLDTVLVYGSLIKEGYSFDDIAELEGVAVSTIKRRFYSYLPMADSTLFSELLPIVQPRN